MVASAVLLLLTSVVVPTLFAEGSNGATAAEKAWTVDAFSMPSAASGVGRAPSVDAAQSVGALQIGHPIFWDGEFVEDSIAGDAETACEAPTARCFSYSFDVPDGGRRLRVAFEDPSFTEFFSISLESPDGTRRSAIPALSKEYLVDAPLAGRWTLHVTGTSVEDATFRMRALLEDAPSAPKHDPGPQDLLPNLRLTPPFEFTFAAPVLSMVVPFGPGSNVGPAQPASCTPGEIANNPNVRRCLRFSFGAQNSGDGPMDLRYRPTPNPLQAVDITQIVYQDDGSSYSRPAGRAEYHARHAHFHHMGFGAVELHRVDDLKKGETTLVGMGPKQGFCLASVLIVDWRAFTQDPTRLSTCESRGEDDPLQESVMWLTRGYADVYWWSMEDTYVDFGSNPDGLYVLRATADPDDNVLEADENDNSGYTFIQVRGNDIEVLERGYGEGPWDKKRTLDSDHIIYDLADTNWLPYTDAK